MLTKSKIKIIQSLDKKKFRQKYNLFVIEGNKIIKELKNSNFTIKEVFSYDEDYDINFKNVESNLISKEELNKISFLKNPSNSLALVELKQNQLIKTNKLQLILDDIQDPGNLGTIIRIADWFGVEQIICSNNTCDFYNPKVIQASMGSFLRVNIFYTDLENFLSEADLPIFSTTMKGKNVYKQDIPQNSFLVLGNEGNGISQKILNLSTDTISIPQLNTHQQTESLNVAMATSILLSEIIGKDRSF